MINHPNRSKKKRESQAHRIAFTLLALFGYGLINYLLNPIATLGAGKVAGLQFQSNDMTYVVSQFGIGFFTHLGISSIVLVGVLALIWWKPAKAVIAALLASIFLIVTLPPAQAYFDTKDITEAYTILPNESAFWIPDVGDNKSSQVQLDSEDYLKSNKLAVKRFVIPHAKLSGTGGWTWDYYVPTGRLIIVDRTPYSHEWVAASDRGTSKANESFPCQTKEGINITAGVSVGASVAEGNAAKYLYRFGTLPPQGERTDPKIIFTSVYYSRSLYSVMGDVGRKKIQTLVCEQIASRTFDQANTDTNPIMDAVRKAATDWFATFGITIEFIGWADTFSFDPPIQKVVNDKYAVDKLGPSVAMLQALTQLKVQEGLGTGLSSHGLPIVVTPDMINALVGMVKAPAK